jgi:hypothetical protein
MGGYLPQLDHQVRAEMTLSFQPNKHRTFTAWGPDKGWVFREKWTEVPDMYLTWHLYAYIERQKDKKHAIRMLNRAKEIVDG